MAEWHPSLIVPPQIKQFAFYQGQTCLCGSCEIQVGYYETLAQSENENFLWKQVCTQLAGSPIIQAQSTIPPHLESHLDLVLSPAPYATGPERSLRHPVLLLGIQTYFLAVDSEMARELTPVPLDHGMGALEKQWIRQSPIYDRIFMEVWESREVYAHDWSKETRD